MRRAREEHFEMSMDNRPIFWRPPSLRGATRPASRLSPLSDTEIRMGQVDSGPQMGGEVRLAGLTSAEKKERKEKNKARAKERKMNRTESQKKADTIKKRIGAIKRDIKAGKVGAIELLERAQAQLAALGAAGAPKPRGRPPGPSKKPGPKLSGRKRSSSASKKRSSSGKKRSSSGKKRSSSGKKRPSRSSVARRLSFERAPTIPLPSYPPSRKVSVRSKDSQGRRLSSGKRALMPIARRRRSGPSKEDLRFALIPRPPSKINPQLFQRPPSVHQLVAAARNESKRMESKIDYKQRHERCERELLQLETDLANLQQELETSNQNQMQIKQINTAAQKELEAIIKRSNTLLKKLKSE